MENEVFESTKNRFKIERFKNGKFCFERISKWDNKTDVEFSLSLDELKELRSLLNEVHMSLLLEDDKYVLAHNKHEESKIINFKN